ncbi:MAG: hypothetical protein KKH68_03805 [Proteobacteria bacterium]|nr:hypothetical protein [Pseudomonadota bacterium]
MHKIAKQFIIFFLGITLVLLPFATAAMAEQQAANDDIGAGAMAADLLIIRPLGIVAVVLGSAFFVVSLPFSALGGNAGNAAKKMIAEPAKFTFKRPLGDF